jgi:hypothetical protein
MYFDPDSITTIKGEFVENLGLWSCYGYGNATGNGMHMLFESSEGTRYYAMLGPWWYLEEQGVVIQESSTAKITGSVVDSYWDGYDEYDYIIATEITVDGVTVKLRNDNGYPLWSGTGWHYYSPGYDTSSTDVIIGTVKRTRVRTNGKNYDPGFEIIVRNNTGRYRLFVSPEWYSDQLKLNIKKGQTIRVKGSVELVRGKRFDVVVRNIRIAGSRHVFRSASGTPVWVKGAR